MAFSKTYIANRALSKLGETRVSNVDTDNTKKAKVIRFMWDSVRDALIQSYPWNFAKKRTQLAADSTAPTWGFNVRYTLPVDFLCLLDIYGNPEYRIEDGFILTDQSAPLEIKYMYRVTNTSKFDAMFVEALANRLAFEGAEEITQSNSKKEILGQEYLKNISDAYTNNSIQEEPIDLQVDEWILARESAVFNDELDYNITG